MCPRWAVFVSSSTEARALCRTCLRLLALEAPVSHPQKRRSVSHCAILCALPKLTLLSSLQASQSFKLTAPHYLKQSIDPIAVATSKVRTCRDVFTVALQCHIRVVGVHIVCQGQQATYIASDRCVDCLDVFVLAYQTLEPDL